MLKNIHALLSIMPRVKLSSYNHRKKTCFKSKVNTMPFKNSFINRLVFKNELAMPILDFLILSLGSLCFDFSVVEYAYIKYAYENAYH